jgi:hypothetical protein
MLLSASLLFLVFIIILFCFVAHTTKEIAERKLKKNVDFGCLQYRTFLVADNLIERSRNGAHSCGQKSFPGRVYVWAVAAGIHARERRSCVVRKA